MGKNDEGAAIYCDVFTNGKTILSRKMHNFKSSYLYYKVHKTS